MTLNIGEINHKNISLTFTQITTLIDDNVDTTSTSYPTAKKTVDVNLALDQLLLRAIRATGKWQVDDSNHTKDPIITTNLVEGQRDYHFTVDEQSNLILDIYRVMVADENGIFRDLELVDQQESKVGNLGMVDGQDIEGNPTKYDKTGNGIFLEQIPSYSYTNGLKLFINREADYFASDDTTKKAGLDGRLHEYLAIRPSYYYAMRKGLKVSNYLAGELLKYEGDEDRGITGLIESIYSKRSKDEPTKIIPKYRSSR